MFSSRFRLQNFYNTSRKHFQQKPLYIRDNVKSFFDISIANKIRGRITFELFAKDCPRTALNFFHLCKGDKTAPDGKVLTYKNSRFHRVIPGFMCQGGDIVSNNGTGTTSMYGPTFGDENFLYSHDKPGLLSMANHGPNTNGCQFFITSADCGWYNDFFI
jgi:peptidylprolyl isomerase